MNLKEFKAELHSHQDPKKAQNLQRFFKTGPGEYGEGDIFLGIKVPTQRILVSKYKALKDADLISLLSSKIHEERLTALLILVLRYQSNKTSSDEKLRLFKICWDHKDSMNNWDLVDLTVYKIFGPYFFERNKKPLYKLASSKNLWHRRIAMMTTFHFIKQHVFNDALKIATMLLNDDEDLIHKAVGWMLREIGNRNINVEEEFLKIYAKKMPRTMLRYAIEKFPEKKRRYYLTM